MIDEEPSENNLRRRDLAEYYEAQIGLFAELCLDRSCALSNHMCVNLC